ncbi:MAG: dihydropteroate synthase [Chloroflexales bacterium]|nr:dihydropteroate synthase [Chloroflexales bacterium]
MGVINVTPDSFSGDGVAASDDPVAAAVAQARRFADEGADILDVGGESTRPGAQPLDEHNEAQRVVPVVAALAQALPMPISVDSYRAPVVAAALDAGAHLVNDIWGLRAPGGGWNVALAELVARRGVPIVLMHNRRAQAVDGHYPAVHYSDLLGEVIDWLAQSVAFAESHGIARQHLLIDPGIGFGKTPAQNIELLRNLAVFQRLQLPVLLGTSRKSFIGIALGGLPPAERDEGTAATTALGIAAGADIVRVHNVRLNARVARVTDAIVRAQKTPPLLSLATGEGAGG